MDKDKLEEIVKKSSTIKEVLSHFGMENKGNNYITLKKRLNADSIDYSHIPQGKGCNKGRKISRKKIDIKKILIKNSTFNRTHLKRRLLLEGLLKNECEICGHNGIWHGEKLVMVLDHINGVGNDNRIKNLRMLCPNCNSQTKTFAGRNKFKNPGRASNLT